MAFGFNFGKSKSKSSSFVDRNQQPFLDFLRNTGQDLASGQLGPIQRQSGALAGQLSTAGRDLLGNLGSNPFLTALQQQAGGNPELVARQSQQLQTDLGQFYNEQLLPGIQSDAIAVNQLGGSRQGVAEGLAAQGVTRSLGAGLTDIYGQDAARSLQASTAGGGLLAQGSLGGLSALEGLYSLGLAPFGSSFQPLLLQNQLVGPPTVLGSGSSNSFNFGLDSRPFALPGIS